MKKLEQFTSYSFWSLKKLGFLILIIGIYFTITQYFKFVQGDFYHYKFLNYQFMIYGIVSIIAGLIFIFFGEKMKKKFRKE